MCEVRSAEADMVTAECIEVCRREFAQLGAAGVIERLQDPSAREAFFEAMNTNTDWLERNDDEFARELAQAREMV